MFTGIVEETGTVLKVSHRAAGASLVVGADAVLGGSKSAAA